jgi:peptidyl-prolyl cis-trans isomerase-like protein 2
VAVVAETEEDEPPRADVFDLMNIVPYVRKFKTSEWQHSSTVTDHRQGADEPDPVSGKPLDTSQLIKLNFFKVCRVRVQFEDREPETGDNSSHR